MKKQVHMKLIAMTLLLAVSIVAVVSASYAWITMSENPAVSGLQISLSGGNTILIAADMTTTVNGVTYHYPGAFSDTLNFAQHESYSYLQNLGGLSPVSTADGVHWFLASYYDEDDPEVLAGWAQAGDLRPVQQFQLDNTLSYANQPADSENLSQGHYVYLDFWVVSPGAEYTLRISTGEDGGTFVIDLLEPQSTADTISGYTLSGGITSTSTSVRVGFLTSDYYATDASLIHYQNSDDYDPRYGALRGVYNSYGTTVADPSRYSFMIYEPNADSHPTGKAEDGSYVATYPIGLVNGIPTPTNVLQHTTVQYTSWWTMASNQTDLLIEQIFQTSLVGKDDYVTAADNFYTDYLQGQFFPYINRGPFVRYSGLLGDTVSAQQMATMDRGGATDDVFIVELERNVPQRIRMYIWLEGQDVDWDPSAAGNRFALSIEFAGGSD